MNGLELKQGGNIAMKRGYERELGSSPDGTIKCDQSTQRKHDVTVCYRWARSTETAQGLGCLVDLPSKRRPVTLAG